MMILPGKPLLDVRNLVSVFDTEEGTVRAVDDVGFSMKKGETIGIVGESGCGKSVTALSILRLLPRPSGRIVSGRIEFQGKDILTLDADKMHEIRGRRISMIFQEPMTALNPVHRIGKQIGEVYRLHFPVMGSGDIREKTIEMLGHVGIPDPEKRTREYPHQISGGMRQRVMIAMALVCRPDLLIADEPTTALDVTIQAQILALIESLQKETGMAVLFITHDLGVIARICESVVVMYAGKIVEKAPVDALFESPLHPYTRGLLAAIPHLGRERKSRLSVIRGMVPSLLDLPEGCRFRNRCPEAVAACETEQPPLLEAAPGHFAACPVQNPDRKKTDSSR